MTARTPRRHPIVVALLLCVTLAAGLVGTPAGAAPVTGPVWAPTLPFSVYQGYMWMSATADGGAFVLRDNADGFGGLLFRSADFGVTWEPLGYAPFGGGGNGAAAFVSKTLGYGVNGTTTLWRTTDGATTWETLPGPTFAGEPVAALRVAAVKGTDVLGVGGITEDGHAVIAVSQDRGETWTSTALGAKGRIYRLALLDADHALVLLGTDGSSMMSDAVYSVTRSSAGLESALSLDCLPEACTAVGFVDDDSWFVGLRDSRLWRTDDGGASYAETATLVGAAPVAPGLEDAYWVEGIEFADAEVGYAATAGRGMFRTTDGGATWTREPSSAEVIGIAAGNLSVADREHAIGAGRLAVVARMPD